ncbi:GPO family capsid scaffolding protein [Sphingobium yanoikuyae]|uniref:Phage capsid protein n=1 Tax=Sphingobium yanoikuyae TaxID=13690 RepID=A0A291N243_SPHYA|nr:GPO family capsid scaffolding protein [Sphingobium yanoikuyae]ATI81474.1 phage capsid protein [Sphingobium yanoikuyae]ATI82917.1 phage capsid protein [Sphingobium yanoikuyae]
MAKSKFFRAFVEGFTVSDGRKIEASWIDDIVATFNIANYTPRINVEHIKGYSPEPPFNGYGDVVAVKAQTDEFTIDGQTVRRRALYVQVEPNDQLIAMRAKGQKPFPSVEISPDFAGTGKIGLTGLGLTDNPASLGVEAFNFAALKPMFDARKSAPNNLFSEAFEAVEIEMEDLPTDSNGIAAAIAAGFASVAAKFTGSKEKPQEQPETPKPANDNGFDAAAFSTAMGEQVAAAIKPISDGLTKMQGDFTALQTRLESTEHPGSFSRQPATGGGGNSALLTDC